MLPICSIRAATDLGPAGDPVLQSAAALAQAVQADLQIIHVAPPWNEDDHEYHASALAEQVDRCRAPLREEAEADVPEALRADIQDTLEARVLTLLRGEAPPGDGYDNPTRS